MSESVSHRNAPPSHHKRSGRSIDLSSAPNDPAPSTIRLRAMLAGMLLCGAIAVGLPYGEFVIQGTQLGLNSATPAAFFLLFVLLVLVQPLVGSVRRAWLFTRAELLVMTVMMMLATAIPSRGFAGVFMTIISGVYYYATPENGWAEQLVPYIPTWMTPHDAEAIKGFYEGLTPGRPIPWAAWAEPLGWWLLFMAAFYMALLCMMVILRKQWMDHERLIYPLTQVPLRMIEDRDPPSRVKPFLKSPVTWLGFMVPFLLHTVNAFSHYFEFVPRFNLMYRSPLFHGAIEFYLRFDCMWMGLAYFINTGVSFSLWFFFLVAKLQQSICATLGIYSIENLDRFSYTHGGPAAAMLSHQVMGAMLVLVLAGLWTARSHLRTVFAQAWRPDAASDAGELMSYRAAVLGLVGGLGTMAAWLWRSGMPAWAVAVYLFTVFVIFLALTRLIVEAGSPAIVSGMSASGVLVSGFGSAALGPSGMIATAYTMVWAGDLLVFMMAPCANGVRMLHGLSHCRMRILGMMAAAMGIGLVGSVWAILTLGYQYGGINLERQYFEWFPRLPFDFASRFISNPTGPNWGGWTWTAVGAAVMTLLTLARKYLIWWPLHPIGYMVSGTWMLGSAWFSIFMGWMVKSVILRYAGPAGYRSTRGFFLGMILGQFVTGGFWLVVDAFAGMVGNRIRMY